MKKRITWIDIVKGIGIILVVMGHSDNYFAQKYFFWFHMPLFFIISGYLFRPMKSNFQLIKKRTFQLLIPYLSFGILLSLILFLNGFSLISFIKDIIKLFYGGQILQGYFAVFWFVTCLFLTQVIFSTLLHYVKKTQIQIAIIVLSYLLAQIIGKVSVFKDLAFPWNFDVMFLAIVYYAIGYYSKNYLTHIIQKTITLFASFVLTILLIYLNSKLDINFRLDMKYSVYEPMFLDILIPLVFTIFIFSVSYQISEIKILFIKHKNIFEYIGAESLTIMYLHFPIKLILKGIGMYNSYSFVILGIMIPFLVSILLFNKYRCSRFLFLGVISKSPNKLEKEAV